MSSQIPGYQVIRKVGEGGMSTVYLAIQLSVGREVALKVLSPELRSDASFAERFYREANILGALSHHNIISVYDVGKHGEHYFMAMDYLPGASCKELTKAKQLKPMQALRIVRDVNAALEHVHKQGYIHCDIKPDNILFRKDGSAVLTDFGIARELKDAKKTSSVAGTPHYMSPEQAQGQKMDERSDLYSLGVLLYEMLTYQVPYRGQDAISVALKHVSAPIPQLPNELSDFNALITKLMAKRPGARLQDTNEVAHAIDYVESKFLKHEAHNIPLQLRVSLKLERVSEKLRFLIKLRKRLTFSLKHGLIYRVVDDQYDIPDIENIAKTLDKSMITNGQTRTTKNIKNDPIAIALKTQQAKQVISTAQLVLSVSIIALVICLPVLIDLFADISQQFSKPKIIYID
jgi:serine/threonine-protein kinase PpkA